MTEIEDDKLLREFFSQEKEEIADNGFSRRVMERLPDRSNRMARWCTLAMAAIATLLFFRLGGVEAIGSTLRETFAGMIRQGAATLDPKSIIIALVVLLYIGTRKICSLE